MTSSTPCVGEHSNDAAGSTASDESWMFSAPARVWERSPSRRLDTRVVQAGRLTTIPPAMRLAEALETTRIHSVAGLTGARTALVTTWPFRAPHHTGSDVGLIGGGQVPMPGEVSRARR